MPTALLVFTDRGIYCEKADVYLDPWKPVDKAIITHSHADHARYGHRRYITHLSNVPILQHRLGPVEVSGKAWAEKFTINGVTFSLHPAGHILGSAQVRVEYRGEVWVFTGDFKTTYDGISAGFELVKCHTLITECTFGIPAFRWAGQDQVMQEINAWWAANQRVGQTSVIFAYTLGKAQRLIKHLDTSIGKIITHAAVENINNIYRTMVALPQTSLFTTSLTKAELSGGLIIAPPSSQGSAWLKKCTPCLTASASGWMAFRGARARRGVDRGFVLSDHADWHSLIEVVQASGAEKIIATHGYTDIFTRYLQELGYDARTEKTQFEAEQLDASQELLS